MKKRISCMLLASALLLGLAACGGGQALAGPDVPAEISADAGAKARPSGGTDPGKIETPEGGTAGTGDDGGRTVCPEETEEPGPVVIDLDGTAANPVWFEDSLQAYLDNGCGMADTSYMVSPASFRAALCLALEGAGGETRTPLLKAAGFGSDGSMRAWYDGLLAARDGFMDRYTILKTESGEWGDGSDPGMAFDIANGLWDNASIDGGFTDAYAELVSGRYGAAVSSSPAGTITDDVNAWCSDATNGMIDGISDDLSGASSVLANALYVKSAWKDGFSGYMTGKGDFTKSSGDIAAMDFMRQTEKFRYSEDEAGRRYAAFGLEGGLWLTVCLDPDARVQDLYGSMYDAGYSLLNVRMPKLDLETSFSAGELAGFLASCGAGGALSDGADFSNMTDSPYGWHIDDIVQKTRLKTDEDGLEAAAATAIMMADNAMVLEPEEPIEFYMDSPFSFLFTYGLYGRDEGSMVLFFGRFAG